jgi:acyl carrier protein
MKSKIRDILKTTARLPVDVATLADDADLYNAGLTSFGTVELMMALEESLRGRISRQDDEPAQLRLRRGNRKRDPEHSERAGLMASLAGRPATEPQPGNVRLQAGSVPSWSISARAPIARRP